MSQHLNIRGFIYGSLLSFAVAALLLLMTLIYGIKESFLLLNGDGGTLADHLFRFITYFGDAVLWVAVLAFVIWKKKKLYLPLATASFAIGIILVQTCKLFIFPDEPRPLHYITDHSVIHTVEGVDKTKSASFPSSHTATAFTFFLMICVMYRKKWWLVVGFCMATLVGYSRIYLAHHFPADVAAGIIAAIVSVAAAIPFQRWIDEKYLRVGETMKV